MATDNTEAKTLTGYSRYQFFDNVTIFNVKTKKFMKHSDDGKNGYRKIKLTNDEGVRVHWWLHRLMYTVFYGPIPPGMEVDHNDGNRLNNCPDNLTAMTKRQNNRMKKQRDSRFLFNRNIKTKKAGEQ